MKSALETVYDAAEEREAFFLNWALRPKIRELSIRNERERMANKIKRNHPVNEGNNNEKRVCC